MDEEQTKEGGEADPKTAKEKVGDGIRQGLGFLSAFKDALEETIQEARDRGDLSADKAKEAVKDALDKAQAAAEGAKGRLDFAHQSELEVVRSAVEAIANRVSALEESVFGASKEPAADAASEGTESGEPSSSAAAGETSDGPEAQGS